MTETKTRPTGNSVSQFLKGIPDRQVRADCRTLSKMMQEETGSRPKMWGDSIVGFGSYRYRYTSGREGEWFLTGFSPRKQNLTLYIMAGFDGSRELLRGLGKFKTGKSCLYVKNLADVDATTLRSLIRKSVRHLKAQG